MDLLRGGATPVTGRGGGRRQRDGEDFALSEAPDPEADLDRTLAALADPYRRRAVDLLRQRPRRAGELARVLQLPAPAMSRHLRMLRQCGLVDETHPEFDARVRIYRLRPGPIAGLKAWLNETEQLWAEQLAALKAHVERR